MAQYIASISRMLILSVPTFSPVLVVKQEIGGVLTLVAVLALYLYTYVLVVIYIIHILHDSYKQ